MFQVDSPNTTSPSGEPTPAEMEALWADHRAREILPRVINLATAGTEGLELARNFIASELCIAHRQGEIDGEMTGERRLMEMHRRVAA